MLLVVVIFFRSRDERGSGAFREEERGRMRERGAERETEREARLSVFFSSLSKTAPFDKRREVFFKTQKHSPARSLLSPQHHYHAPFAKAKSTTKKNSIATKAECAEERGIASRVERRWSFFFFFKKRAADDRRKKRRE